MTKKGFKVIVVREQAYFLASKQAKLDETSIANVVTKAIERYINRRMELEEELKLLVEIYERHRRRSVPLSSSQSAP